jgi:hypothetical protein
MPSSTPEGGGATWKLIAVPAAITLAVTALRLTGEMLHWSPRFFSREAGGGLAVVGIAWLVPMFGIWFALKLKRSGAPSPRILRGIGIALAALVVAPAVGLAAVPLGLGPVGQVVMFCLGSLAAIAVGRLAWPALGRVLLAYGLAARLPVVLIMLLAMLGRWDSHYALPRPDFPPMAPLPLWLLTGFLPQLTMWIAYTVVFGSLFGLIAAAVSRSGRAGAAMPAA